MMIVILFLLMMDTDTCKYVLSNHVLMVDLSIKYPC